MPRGGMFFILLVIMSVGLLTLLWPMIPSAQIALRRQNSVFNSKNSQPLETVLIGKYKNLPIKFISDDILNEASRSGQLDQNPMDSEKRLNALAQRLSSQDIQTIVQVVKTSSNNSDLRALAVDLLARSSSASSLEPLEQIIISRWPALNDPSVISFEQSLRARAIEGLEGHPSPQATRILQQALIQTNDSFLNDHGQRALLHRQGQAKSVEEQDQEALRKILQR